MDYRYILCNAYSARNIEVDKALCLTSKICKIPKKNIESALVKIEIKKIENTSSENFSDLDEKMIKILCRLSKKFDEKYRLYQQCQQNPEKLPSPPFKWAGGKRKMISSYSNIFFPPKPIQIFVDMFCGAGSISLWVFQKYPSVKIILNDVNKELIDMYSVIRNQYPKFEKEYIKIVKKCPSSKEERKQYYYRLRDEHCHQYKNLSRERIAAGLFFMLKTNFNGLWKVYKKCDLRYSTPPGTMTFSSKFLNVETIKEFSKFLNRCELRCGDFSSLKKYFGPSTYFYADPPYRSTDVLYQGGFGDRDQIRLANFLKKADQAGSWISESNREIGDRFWEKHFPKFKKHYLKSISYTAGRSGSHSSDEVLVTNF